MDPLTDFGVAVAGEVATSSLAKIKKHVSYVYNYKDNIDALKEARAHLDAKRADASKFSDEAETRLREVASGVKDWQSDANKLHKKAEELISRNNISCLNLWSWYSSSKHAWELTQDISDKVRSAPDFGTSFNLQILEGEKFNLKGFMEFKSRRTILDRVLKVLRDEDVSMYSICGMGGIGKNTMAKKLVQLVEAEHLFDKVAMVTVSQYPKFEKIQNEIIELLGLKFDESSVAGRAKKLKYWLSNNKNLLILDDVWWQFHDDDFENIGIPLATKECKIVVTSRNEDECRKMGSQSNFRLSVLDDGEARDLFMQNAEKRFEDRSLQETARKIIDECDGLPIAIVTIARALKDKPAGVWEDSLRKLQKSNFEGISGMEKVHSRIQLSYDLLNDREARECFRLCCLFPEDYNFPVQLLVFYGWGLELFEGVGSLKEARYRVDLIVDKLKKSFLLLDGEMEGSVRLHDIIRDFAMSISSKNEYPYLIRLENELEEWPETCQYEKCSAISLICKKLNNFPVGLRYPNLKLLQIFCEEDSGRLHDGLCEGMEELKGLFLYVTTLSRLTLPKKLRILMIVYAPENGPSEVPYDYFGNILGDVGDMKNLEMLSLTSLRFNDFPKEIGLLCNLRCLMFNSSISFVYMPPNVLSNLVKLEELELPLGYNRWGLDDEGGHRVNASLDELESLPLTSLVIHIPEGSILAEKLVTRITGFQIFVGNGTCVPADNGFGLNSNILQVNGADEFDVNATWISILMRKCDELILSGVKELKHKNGVPNTYFSQLKVLKINDVDGLEEIVRGPYLSNKHPHCFDKLTKIKIKGCPKLKRAFPLSVAQQLTQLQSLKIDSCQQLKEIFYKDQVNDTNQIVEISDGGEIFHDDQEDGGNQAESSVQVNALTMEITRLQNPNDETSPLICPTPQLLLRGLLRKPKLHKNIPTYQIIGENVGKVDEREADWVIVWPRLKRLYLCEIPNLRVMYNGDHAIECPSLEQLQIVECNNMEGLSYGSFSAPKTKNLHISGEWTWKNIAQWLHLEQDSVIPQLQQLQIESCNEMIYLVDAMTDCNLEDLHIKDMNSLEEIWNGPYLSIVQPQPCFSHLVDFTIRGCPKLKHVFPLLVATELTQLRWLWIETCEEMEEIFYKDQVADGNQQTVKKTTTKKEVDDATVDAAIFPQLKFLFLKDLTKFRIFYDGNHAIELPSLEHLVISGCNKVKALSNGSFKAPKLTIIEINQERYRSGEDLNTVVKKTLNIDNLRRGQEEEDTKDEN